MEFLKFKKIFDKFFEYSTDNQNTMPVFVMHNGIKYGFTFDLQRYIGPDENGNFGKINIIHNEDPMCLYDINNALISIFNTITGFGGNPASFIMDHNYEVDYTVNIRYDNPNDNDFSISECLIMFIDERDFG